MHITTSSLLFNDTFFRCKISINIQCLNWHTGTKKLQNSQTYSLKKCIQGGQNLPKKINIHVPQFGTLEYIFDQIQFQNQKSDQTTQSLETKLVWNLASSKYYLTTTFVLATDLTMYVPNFQNLLKCPILGTNCQKVVSFMM